MNYSSWAKYNVKIIECCNIPFHPHREEVKLYIYKINGNVTPCIHSILFRLPDDSRWPSKTPFLGISSNHSEMKCERNRKSPHRAKLPPLLTEEHKKARNSEKCYSRRTQGKDLLVSFEWKAIEIKSNFTHILPCALEVVSHITLLSCPHNICLWFRYSCSIHECSVNLCRPCSGLVGVNIICSRW